MLNTLLNEIHLLIAIFRYVKFQEILSLRTLNKAFNAVFYRQNLWENLLYMRFNTTDIRDLAKLSISIADLYSVTPLMLMANYGQLNLVNELIAAKANVNANTADTYHPLESFHYGNRGVTPLILATKNRHAAVVSTLIYHDADINSRTLLNETPLDIAVKNKDPEVAKIISRVKLDQVMNKIARAPVSKSAYTLFGVSIRYGYTKEEKLLAAGVLKIAVDAGDETLVSQYRNILESTEELAPLYRHLTK